VVSNSTFQGRFLLHHEFSEFVGNYLFSERILNSLCGLVYPVSSYRIHDVDRVRDILLVQLGSFCSPHNEVHSCTRPRASLWYCQLAAAAFTSDILFMQVYLQWCLQTHGNRVFVIVTTIKCSDDIGILTKGP
jgi:hypothetical protein